MRSSGQPCEQQGLCVRPPRAYWNARAPAARPKICWEMRVHLWSHSEQGKEWPHFGQYFGTFTKEEVVVFCEKWEVDRWKELLQMYLQICNLVGFSSPDRYQLFKVLKLRSFGRWQDGLDVLRAAIASMVKAAWLTLVLRLAKSCGWALKILELIKSSQARKQWCLRCSPVFMWLLMNHLWRFPAALHLPFPDFPNCKWVQLPTGTRNNTTVDVTRYD